MRVVLDASVIIKWVFPDPAREDLVEDAARVLAALARGSITVVQPPHWLAEVAAVVTRLDPALAPRALRLLHAMELPIRDGIAVYVEAASLGARLGQHVFDTLYHAVARLEPETTLVTADGAYFRAARRLGRIRPLAGFAPA